MPSENYHRRWYVNAFWVAIIPLTFLFGAASVVSEVLSTVGLLVIGLGSLVLGVWALAGYYYDAQAADETGYRPRWWAWALAHLILSPIITSPIYLLRRTMKTGFPPRVASALGR